MERQLVMRLTNKLINQFNEGHPLMVMQVFESENTSGVIFVEAYKLSHVEQLTRGMADQWCVHDRKLHVPDWLHAAHLRWYM